jgi:hypothetical protein
MALPAGISPWRPGTGRRVGGSYSRHVGGRLDWSYRWAAVPLNRGQVRNGPDVDTRKPAR